VPQGSPHSSPRPSVSAGMSQLDAIAELQQLRQQVQHLYAAQQAIASQGSSSSAPRTAELPRIRQPSTFAGAMGFSVDDWLSEMTQQFAYYGAKFPDHASCIRFAASFFTGAALHWWEHMEDRSSLVDWNVFKERLHTRFRPVQAAMLARQRLGKLSQRVGQTVNQYTGSFQMILTPIADMGDADQVHHYVNGLVGPIAAKVWERHPKTLKEAIDYAVSVEAMQHYGRAAMNASYRGGSSSSSSSAHHTSAPMEISVNNLETSADDPEEKYPAASSSSDPLSAILAKMEAMEHRLNALSSSSSSSGSGSSRPPRSAGLIPGLQPDEIARMQKEGLCFRCKKKGHMKNECPQRPKNE
jgi:hypothetical protein